MQTKPGHAATTPQLGRHEIGTSGSTITFRARHLFGLAPARGTLAILTGALTVGGVTRPVILPAGQYAVSPLSFTARATTRIDGTGFGVTAARGLAGRFPGLTIEVRCDRR